MFDSTHHEKRPIELEQILVMIELESKPYRIQRTLPEIHAIWRRKICEWAYNVVDHFHLDREVVGLSLNFLDRYMALREFDPEKENQNRNNSVEERTLLNEIDGRTFQLVATTALYVAIKIHGEHIDRLAIEGSQNLGVNAFVDLSRGQFCAEDIKSMELQLLSTLDWRVNPPTPVKFSAYLLRLLPTQLNCNKNKHIACQGKNENKSKIDERVAHVVYELSRYLTEVSVYVYSLSITYRPSAVAYATILISINLINSNALPQENRDIFNARVKRFTSLHPKSKDVMEIISQVKEICPEITDSENHYSLIDSKEHPISIAREAGFLASSTSTKKTRVRENLSFHSPCSVASNNVNKSGQ